MFHFLNKTLLLQYGRRRRTVIATNYYKHFAFPICISITTTTSKEDSFTVSYLMNSCGFSLKSALSASKYVNFDSPEKPNSVIALFKTYGFSESQISKLIRKYPKLLCISPEKTLLPKLEFFYSKGFSRSDIAKISSADPKFLHRSLENYIIPNFNCLIDFFKSSERAVAAVKCSPRILNLEGETYLASIINVLRDIGVPERHILLFLRMWHCPGDTNCFTFRHTVEVLTEMGFNPSTSQFIQAVVAKLYGRTHWESRVNIYRRWDWSEEQVLAAFRRNPLCMTASKDKIMAVMDFLVNKMNMESSAIAKRPYFIGHSVEKRFIPRAAVFQFLLSKGLINRKNTNLISLFTMSEKAFLQKFVNSYDEASEILKLYEEALGISKMRKTSVSREKDGVLIK